MADRVSARVGCAKVITSVLVTIGALLLCGFVSYIGLNLSTWIDTPPTVWQNPPIYPDAKQVRTQNVSLPGKEMGITIKKIVSFHTDAKPEEILAFYRNKLIGAGWQESSSGSAPKEVYFITSRGNRSPEMFIFDVAVTSSNIQISLGDHPGY